MAHDFGPPTVRHRLADRLFHWLMAAAVIVLGATAFLPIMGIRFDWVPWHWTAGIALAVAVLFHLYRVFFVQGIKNMVPGTDDVSESMMVAAGRNTGGLQPAKYDAFQKGFHLGAAITILTVLITGLIMLAKIDTTFWNRNPAMLTDATWGLIYVLHGGGALVLLFLVILHVYFGLLPEHRVFLTSMLSGKGPQYSRGEPR